MRLITDDEVVGFGRNRDCDLEGEKPEHGTGPARATMEDPSALIHGLITSLMPPDSGFFVSNTPLSAGLPVGLIKR